jgi:hypothetical protein
LKLELALMLKHDERERNRYKGARLKAQSLQDLSAFTSLFKPLQQLQSAQMAFARLASIVAIALAATQVNAALTKRVTCPSGHVTANAACCG